MRIGDSLLFRVGSESPPASVPWGFEEDGYARWRGYPLSQLLYRFRAVSETKSIPPFGTCLLTHNLWEIASFYVFTPIAK
jgi:hypothetical protein